MSDIKDIPVVSVDQALQGRIAGADIMATTGEPGATTSIRIRGTRSISASNEPLIIVDGVIDGIHDLNDINSADIESISVLKDASSTAIYGARGSNGVIVITTKKGRGVDGRPSITFKTDLGFSQLPRQLDIMNATEFARYRNDYAYFFSSADGNDKIEPDSPISKYPFPNPEAKGAGTNWIDTITRTALYQNYDLSISGASAKSSYYASAGFNETQGIIDNSGLKRYSARLKVDHKFAKWLKAGLNLSYTYRDQDENLATIGGTNWWNAAVFLSPFLTPHIRHERPVVFGTEIQQPAPHARPLFQERPAHFAQQQRIRRGNTRQGTEAAQPVHLLLLPAPRTLLRAGLPARQKKRTKAVTPNVTSTTTRVSPARIRSTTNYAPRAATTSTCWADTPHRSSTTTT